jgi:hypothetical protein
MANWQEITLGVIEEVLAVAGSGITASNFDASSDQR